MVRLLFFAGVREDLGVSAESIVLPPEVTTIGALRTLLCARGGPWSRLAGARSVRFAVNRAMVSTADAPVRDGDEVAIFPPVTGG